MKVLVACEFSGRVRNAFRKRGHDAWSCDLLPAMDNSEYHFQQDVLDILYDDCWDLLIAHPPCTYLCNSGVCRLYNKDGSYNEERWQKMIEAAIFFRTFLCSGIPRICVENPVMHKYALEHIGRKHNQTIQPYQFGHAESKRTCLWLDRLPLLKPTKIVEKPECGYWGNQCPGGQNKLGPSKDRWKLRAITYQGIADAIGEQWNEQNLNLFDNGISVKEARAGQGALFE